MNLFKNLRLKENLIKEEQIQVIKVIGNREKMVLIEQ